MQAAQLVECRIIVYISSVGHTTRVNNFHILHAMNMHTTITSTFGFLRAIIREELALALRSMEAPILPTTSPSGPPGERSAIRMARYTVPVQTTRYVRPDYAARYRFRTVRDRKGEPAGRPGRRTSYGKGRQAHVSGQSWLCRQHDRHKKCMYNTYTGRAALRLGHGWAGTSYGKGRQAHVSGQSWPCWHVVHTWQQAGHGAVFRRTARMRFTWLAFPMLQAARLHRQLHHRPSHRCRYR